MINHGSVSRLHAEILPVEGGYRIHDRSTNGLFVNGTRVDGSQLLSRADVIRAGTEELRFYADAAQAQALLAGLVPHLGEACLGTISEIFDGDSPHTPRGCIAQAWSVAETLRAWFTIATGEASRAANRAAPG